MTDNVTLENNTVIKYNNANVANQVACLADYNA